VQCWRSGPTCPYKASSTASLDDALEGTSSASSRAGVPGCSTLCDSAARGGAPATSMGAARIADARSAEPMPLSRLSVVAVGAHTGSEVTPPPVGGGGGPVLYWSLPTSTASMSIKREQRDTPKAGCHEVSPSPLYDQEETRRSLEMPRSCVPQASASARGVVTTFQCKAARGKMTFQKT
jgi:hypothetical protein